MRHFPLSLLRQGGAWLGSVRTWMQSKFVNGDSVTWGSDEVLRGPPLTVKMVEEIGAVAAASERTNTEDQFKIDYAKPLFVEQTPIPYLGVYGGKDILSGDLSAGHVFWRIGGCHAMKVTVREAKRLDGEMYVSYMGIINTDRIPCDLKVTVYEKE